MVLFGLWKYNRDCRKGWGKQEPASAVGKTSFVVKGRQEEAGAIDATKSGDVGSNGQLGLPRTMMQEPLVLQDCRGPQCRYKAPVCEYGYCAVCCRKHHNYAITGLNEHKVPVFEPISHGFKVVERGKVTTGTTSVVITLPDAPPEPPVCGTLEPTTCLDFPVEDGGGHYKTI